MPEREDDHEALAAGLDIDIGRRIKLRRIQLGLSQSDLARKIGPVAFQQVQKYENGTEPRVGKPAVSDRRSTWRRHRVFLRASTTPLPASTPRPSRARSIAWASGTRSRSSNASAT